MDEAGVKPKPTLEELARERFPDLSEAELKLLRAAPKGLPAQCGDPAINNEEPVNNPTHADTWSEERDIRHDLIRWLCVEPDAQSRIDPLGIRIQSARISGELDLSFVVVRFPLIFHSCKFAGPLRLMLADLHLLDLSGSAAAAVFAEGTHIRGPVLLHGFSAEGEVNLYGASVGGNLECQSGRFKNADGYALIVERAKIEGSVYLRQGFSAEGEVNLYGASVGGNLTCESGSFKNARSPALNAALAKIQGSVYLRQGFSAEGEVNLYGASVGGNLTCESGRFKNADGFALNAALAKIEGSVYLRDGFSAEGVVSLYGTSIGGNLECDKGSFKNLGAGAAALNFELAKIERAVFLNKGFTAIGGVMLGGTAIAGDLNITGANLEGAHLDMQRTSAGALLGEPATWPEAGKLFLDSFSYRRLAEGPTDASHRLRWLRLQLSPTTKGSFSPQPYRHLAQVLRQQGHEAAAQQILIGLEDDRRKYGSLTWAQRLWAFISKWTIAYGYRPLRALWFIGIFVILGFLVFGSAYQSGQLVPSDKEAYEKFKSGQLPGSYDGFCALVYSFETFVPIIDLGQRSRWKPIDTENEVLKSPKRNESNDLVCAICDPMALVRWRPPLAVRFIRFYRWLDILAGWFFTVLFAAGISGLVRRD